MTDAPASLRRETARAARVFFGPRHHRTNAALVALLLTLLIHAGLFVFLPWRLEVPVSDPNTWRQEVRIVFEETPERQDERFVEANPNVPTNPPDETNQFAARDQQAAQKEESDEGPTDQPMIDGEMENASKIVEAQQPQPPAPATPSGSPAQPQEAVPPAETAPPPTPTAPDFLAREPPPDESEEGIASHLEPDESEEEVDDPSQDRVVNAVTTPDARPDQPERQQQRQEQQQPAPMTAPGQPSPRPRPRVDAQVLPGPVRSSIGRAPVLNITAVNARFSEFGDYLQQLYDAIGITWINLARRVEAVHGETSTKVLISFVINPEGKLVALRIEDDTTASNLATTICQDAVQSVFPFHPWTEEMVRTLDDTEELRVGFIYR